jgi:hypothetical protein
MGCVPVNPSLQRDGYFFFRKRRQTGAVKEKKNIASNAAESPTILMSCHPSPRHKPPL